MKKAAVVATLVGLGAFVVPALSNAGSSGKSHELSATLSPRAVVTVKNKPASFPAAIAKNAAGTFNGTTSADGKSLKWKLAYGGLGHPALVIADIHIGPAGKFGPILVRLCGPCKPGQSGTTKLKKGYATRLATQPHWLTLITNTYPNGVVRGQLKVK